MTDYPAVDPPPLAPFRAPFLKIERAQRHLSELKDIEEKFMASNPVKCSAIIIEPAPGQHGGVQINMEVPPTPEEISAIIGDIIHNLRGSLDVMACEICGTHEARFPFCGSEDELDGMIERRNFSKAGAAAVALLKEYKPYKNGNLMLRALHDLDIQDKHQALIVNTVMARSPRIEFPLMDGRQVPVVIGDPNKPTDIQFVFPKGSALEGRLLIKALEELVELTTCLVEAFKSLAAPASQPPVIGD